MANRYWVGGNGNWDDTAHWAASSGGAGSQTVPTSSDDVIIDTDVTVGIASSRNAVCNNLTFTAGTTIYLNEDGLFSDNVTIYGNLDMGGRTGLGSFITKATFASTSIGKTLTLFTGGGQSAIFWVVFDGVGGGWTLLSDFGDDFTKIKPCFKVELKNGTLDTNGKYVYCQNFICNGSGTRTLTLGASTISIFSPDNNNANKYCYADFSGTNLTLNSDTSSIELGVVNDYFYSVLRFYFIGNGKTFYNVKINLTAAGSLFLTGSNIYNNLEIKSNDYSGSYAIRVYITDNQTITGTFTVSSVNDAFSETRIYIIPSTLTIITAAIVSLVNVDFKNVIGAGTATWTGTRIGNQGNNTNITFDTPRTLYWIGNAGNWVTFASWSLSSGGAGGEKFPLPQDDVIFDANSFNANNQELVAYFPVLGNDITFANLDVIPIFHSYSSQSLGTPTSANSLTISSSIKFQTLNLTVNDLIFDTAPITITFGRHLNFGGNSYFTTNTFTANGSVGNLITLTGATTITATTDSISYVAVDNNHALGAAIPFDDSLGGVNNGDNINWYFNIPSPSISPSPSAPPDSFLQTARLVGSNLSGDVQQVNMGKSDDEGYTSTPIYYELETQELEFTNRAIVKAITDKLGIASQYADDSKIEIIEDNKDPKPININMGKRINTITLPQLKGHYITLRWSGNSTTKSPVLEGFYLNKITNDSLG